MESTAGLFWIPQDSDTSGSGAESLRNQGRKKRRQGVQLAGKKSGVEGPGFGIHCFIINNPGYIEPQRKLKHRELMEDET